VAKLGTKKLAVARVLLRNHAQDLCSGVLKLVTASANHHQRLVLVERHGVWLGANAFLLRRCALFHLSSIETSVTVFAQHHRQRVHVTSFGIREPASANAREVHLAFLPTLGTLPTADAIVQREFAVEVKSGIQISANAFVVLKHALVCSFGILKSASASANYDKAATGLSFSMRIHVRVNVRKTSRSNAQNLKFSTEINANAHALKSVYVLKVRSGTTTTANVLVAKIFCARKILPSIKKPATANAL
jgi:hypothetical protein